MVFGKLHTIKRVVCSGGIAVLLLAIFSGCVSTHQFTVEVLQPAKLTLSPGKKDVALFYRNFKYTGDTLQDYHQHNYQLVKDNYKQKVNIDSLAVTACFVGLINGLKTTEKFDSASVLPLHLVKRHQGEKIPDAGRALIDYVKDNTGADLIIALETYSCFYSSYRFDYGEQSADVVTTGIWSLYDPGQGKMIDRYAVVDTVFWVNRPGMAGKGKIPGKVVALVQASELMGKDYARRLAPHWNEVYRTILVPAGKNWSKAAKMAKEDQWEPALELWQSICDTEPANKQWRCLYNMAVASEMLGEMEPATLQVNQALKTGKLRSADRKFLEKYRKILLKRSKELQIIESNK